jgi:hypothetical protein
VLGGEAVRVTLPAAARVRPARKRIIRVAPFAHYAGWSSGRGGRPRCLAKGCCRYLRRNQPFACSAEHEAQVRSMLQTMQVAVQGERCKS